MSLLNNRQSGRRRGRTGQRPQGNGGRGQEQGNRIDNRARGNAPQMLEKYKALARDAQMQGDRVITEYYLQFADHYFRVVAEMRARQEETRRQRDDWQGDDGDSDLLDGDDQASAETGDGDDELAAERAHDAQRRQPRQQQQRDNGRARDNRGADADGGYRNNRPPRREMGGFDDSPRDGGDRADQVRRVFAGSRSDNDAATIDVNVLPPAFGSDGPITPIADLVDLVEAETADVAPKRRGRPRKPVGDDAVA
jgi:hypothetical protein